MNERGLDLGRDTHLDWTLPDGSRIVSGKHCEIRFSDGGYWLCDVSTNGTFVNDSPHRLDAPYLLHDGDRLKIGPYIIAVSVQGGQEARRTTAPASSAPAPGEWEMFGRAAPPGDRAGRPVHASPTGLPDLVDFDPLFEPPKAPRSDPATQRPDSWPPEPAAPPVAVTREAAPPHSSPFRSAPSPPGVSRISASEPQAGATDAALFGRIARAAGMPESALASRDPNILAEEIGSFIRLTAENLAQMLASRAEFENTHAIGKSNDGSRDREQPPQIRQFGGGSARDDVRRADAAVPRRAGHDRR